jgi:hypothetical protein
MQGANAIAEKRDARLLIKNVFSLFAALCFLLGAGSSLASEESPPTTAQLNTQISILKDQVKALSAVNDQYKQRAVLADQKVLDAYIELKKREFDYYAHLMDVNIETFHAQRIASYVILLLVFVVVTSGILFAGFQLWKSVSLAGVQASNDLEISAAKVRVTSSVVGIVVLAISLAFLFIYTREVYTIKSLPSIQSSSSTESH